MGSSHQKLSILIAAYNVEQFIERCVLSCYNEKLSSSYEIIVVNDGSTDDTAEIIETLKNKVPNLKLVSKSNSGLGAARNTGLQHALGKYAWMIDGDDFLTEDAVKTVLSNLSSGLDVYAYNFNITDEAGNVIKIQYTDVFPEHIITGSEYYALNYESSYTPQFIFKKSLFDDNNIWFQERINMQDSEILPRLLYHVNKIVYNASAVYNYVQHETSFTNTKNPSKRLQYFKSIMTVNASLEDFKKEISLTDARLAKTIEKKQEALHRVVFYHVAFFPHSSSNFKVILSLLKEHNFYPLQASLTGKLKLLKLSLNIHPSLTKRLIDNLR